MKRIKFKKIVASLLLAGSIISIGSISTNAASARFSFSFNSGGNGGAYVDGSSNGKYYSLNSGIAYMNVSSFSKNGLGTTANVTLKREKRGFDASYGTNSVSGTGKFSWDVDTTSGSYYLFVTGNSSYTQYDVSGTIYN